MNRKRRKKKATVVNKTRFAIFCIICILLLAFIFIKIFMPAIHGNLSAPGANNEEPNSEVYVETDPSQEESNAPEEYHETYEAEAKENEKDPNLPGKYTEILESNQGDYIYYRQTDPMWTTKTYGPADPIGTHGCGPTVMASIISSLTGDVIDPEEMSDWAFENGYHVPDAGSLHSLIPESAEAFGLNAEPMYYPSPEQLEEALNSGKYVVMCSGHGRFSTEDGHFIALIDIDDNGNIQVSDSIRHKHISMPWTSEEIINEASPVSSAGGPFWAIWK